MNRITDMYGPIPYRKFGSAVQIAYDSQKDVYNQFFNELDSAINVMTEYVAHNSNTYLEKYDNVYSGNVKKWVKFANTLRLRLAMRISNIDETLAKKEAEAAINHSIGLMTVVDDDAILHQSSTLTFRHPLWEIGTSWDDEHMSATMDCYLNGYQDPRMAVYFQSASSTGKYKGARNGMSNITKANYQAVTSRPNYMQGSNMNWMHDKCFDVAAIIELLPFVPKLHHHFLHCIFRIDRVGKYLSGKPAHFTTQWKNSYFKFF